MEAIQFEDRHDAGRRLAKVLAGRTKPDLVLALPRGEIEGRPLQEVLHHADLIEFITQAPDTGLVRNSRIRVSTGRVYRATLTPIRDIGRSVVMQEEPRRE